MTVAVLLALTPTGAHLVRDVLHLGGDPTPLKGEGHGKPSCPDGVAYAIPAAIILIGGPGLAFPGALVCGLRQGTVAQPHTVAAAVAVGVAAFALTPAMAVCGGLVLASGWRDRPGCSLRTHSPAPDR